MTSCSQKAGVKKGFRDMTVDRKKVATYYHASPKRLLSLVGARLPATECAALAKSRKRHNFTTATQPVAVVRHSGKRALIKK
ncbi:hypothetical protein ASF84_11185 [Pseudomonas sp. Leaf127]|nr:hypothetical protein ASF84_11185 [Pseudomonas sp. Leaf127]